MKSAIKSFYVVAKRSFKGRYITPDKKEADDLLEPGTIVDCFENGIHTSSYGLISSPELEPRKQIEDKVCLTEKKIKGVRVPSQSKEENVKTSRMEMLEKAQRIARKEIEKNNESNSPF